MHLSQVSVEEAKNTVDLWYKERQEVLEWQKQRKYEAEKLGRVKTLLGRARRFPSFAHCTRAQKGHIERAAINTPVQVFSSFSCTQVSLSLCLSLFLFHLDECYREVLLMLQCAPCYKYQRMNV